MSWGSRPKLNGKKSRYTGTFNLDIRSFYGVIYLQGRSIPNVRVYSQMDAAGDASPFRDVSISQQPRC